MMEKRSETKEEKARRYAGQAEALEGKYVGDEAIYRVLDQAGIREDRTERDWYISAIKKELGLRKKSRDAIMMRDAKKHEDEDGPGETP